MMLKEAEFNWNLDSDERAISEARAEIESLNDRLDSVIEREQAQENDEEQEQPEIKWPSISDRF